MSTESLLTTTMHDATLAAARRRTLLYHATRAFTLIISRPTTGLPRPMLSFCFIVEFQLITATYIKQTPVRQTMSMDRQTDRQTERERDLL